MSTSLPAITTAVVTGASRGFGRAIAVELAGAGHPVVALARDFGGLATLGEELGDRVTLVAGDAADPVLAGHMMDQHQPGVLVLNAGAAPLSRPLHQHTWQTFSRNWDVDVQHVFGWTREALLRPMPPGSVVVAMSSGAAVKGSQLSGGYAGAKAAIRFISGYARAESERAGLGIRFIAVLPQLTPATDLGAAAVAAYAARQGVDPDAYAQAMGPALTPERAAKEIAGLIADPGQDHPSYLLTAAGLSPLE